MGCQMETANEANQFLTEAQLDSRRVDVRVWMIRHGQTFTGIGAALGGITGPGVQKMLQAERISTDRYTALKDYGVPEELLPPAKDVRRGRPRKQNCVD